MHGEHGRVAVGPHVREGRKRRAEALGIPGFPPQHRPLVSFRERPYDLYGVLALSVSLAILLVAGMTGPIRIALGLLSVFALPGYAILSALFPRDREMRWLDRIAYGLGLSVASVSLLAVALTYTPWGFRAETIFAVLTTFTIGVSIVAYRRRMALPPETRLSLSLALTLPRWREFSKENRWLAAILLGSLLAAGVFGATTPSGPPAAAFTEFYMLDASGGVTDYPSRVNASQEARVRLGVVNHEGRAVTYSIDVRLVAVSSVNNETRELWNVTHTVLSASLTHSEAWEEEYRFHVSDRGMYFLRFYLFAGPIGKEPRGFLSLPLQVA